MNNLLPIERIEQKIYLIRGQKVMLGEVVAICDHLQRRGKPKKRIGFCQEDQE